MASESNASARIADATTTHTVNLMRLAEGQRQEVLASLEKLETSLVKDLEDTVGKSAAKIARLKALLKQTQQTIATAYEGIKDQQG